MEPTDFPFKIGDRITYKDDTLANIYIVVSTDPTSFWMKHTEQPIYLRYDPSEMKLSISGYTNGS